MDQSRNPSHSPVQHADFSEVNHTPHTEEAFTVDSAPTEAETLEHAQISPDSSSAFSRDLRVLTNDELAKSYQKAFRVLNAGMAVGTVGNICSTTFFAATAATFLWNAGSTLGNASLGIASVCSAILVGFSFTPAPIIGSKQERKDILVEDWEKESLELSSKANVKKPVLLFPDEMDNGAFCINLLNGPHIVVGRNIREGANAASRKFILAHEIAHFQGMMELCTLNSVLPRISMFMTAAVLPIAFAQSTAFFAANLAVCLFASTMGKALAKVAYRANEIKTDLRALLLTEDPSGAYECAVLRRTFEPSLSSLFSDKIWEFFNHPPDVTRLEWISRVWGGEKKELPKVDGHAEFPQTRMGLTSLYLFCELARRTAWVASMPLALIQMVIGGAETTKSSEDGDK